MTDRVKVKALPTGVGIYGPGVKVAMSDDEARGLVLELLFALVDRKAIKGYSIKYRD